MKKTMLVLISCLLLILSACSSNNTSSTASKDIKEQAKPKGNIVIASKNFTEQYLLAQIMGQLLKNKTQHNVKITEGGFGSSAVLNQGMKDGNIQVIVDYTGSGYINVLKNKLLPDDNADSVYQKTKEAYEKQFGFIWLKPLGFTNTFTLVLKSDKAKTLNVNNFSDLAKYSSDLVVGMDSTFFDRADGYKGLIDKYGFAFKDHKEMDISLAFSALSEGKIDVLVAYSTDGRIPSLKLASLKDNKNYFPPYFAAPIIPKEVMEKYPDVAEVLNQLAGKLDENTMAGLNAKVDMDKKETQEVAKEFLKSSGLIK